MIWLLVPLVLLLLVAVALLWLAIQDREVPVTAPPPVRRVVRRLVESEREFAAGLGWAPGRWLLLRAVVFVLALVLGLRSQVPILTALAVLLGATLLRFALATAAEQRRGRQARAFLTFMTAIGDGLHARGLELASVVRAAAAEVPREVEELLAPVAAAAGDVFSVLVDQVEGARSGPLGRCCAVLLTNRDRDLGMVARLIGEEVAELEAELDDEDQRLQDRAESRWIILALGTVLMVFAAVLNQVDSFHQLFLTARGQVGLLVSMLVFATAAVVMVMLQRTPGMSRWDLRRMNQDLVEVYATTDEPGGGRP